MTRLPFPNALLLIDALAPNDPTAQALAHATLALIDAPDPDRIEAAAAALEAFGQTHPATHRPTRRALILRIDAAPTGA